jgi:hypothetical protein
MINPEHHFTTDSSPDEEEFEKTVRDATSHFKDTLRENCQWYLGNQDPIVREGVRTALKEDGIVTPTRIEDIIHSKTLGERYSERDRDAILAAFQEAITLMNR